jgi:hypothetical protein
MRAKYFLFGLCYGVLVVILHLVTLILGQKRELTEGVLTTGELETVACYDIYVQSLSIQAALHSDWSGFLGTVRTDFLDGGKQRNTIWGSGHFSQKSDFSPGRKVQSLKFYQQNIFPGSFSRIGLLMQILVYALFYASSLLVLRPDPDPTPYQSWNSRVTIVTMG